MSPANFVYTNELILIVEDDPSLREKLEKLSINIGIYADSTSNINDALKILNNNDKEFTILLTDMKLLGINGIDLIKRICNDFDINVIAMTAVLEDFSYTDIINAGASDFIKKPFGANELEAKIRRIITERNLRRELNRLSITDSLTELYNQRHFYTRLQEEITRAERQRHPLSLILMDLDDFKYYNDTYGHLAGDEILRSAGLIINSCIREGVDTGYRYGGDEFAIILIDADIDIAKGIGLRIEKVFKNTGQITVSTGYSIFSKGMSVKDLVSEADKSLYKSKMNSKDSA